MDDSLLERLQNVGVPIRLTSCIANWKLLKYSESDWCEIFSDRLLRFRKGFNCVEQEPFWEGKCSEENLTLEQFFASTRDSSDGSWMYFDYQYMKDLFADKSDFLKEVRWSDLGLDLAGKESTLWIGSRGAHTPCHMDTYGCNLVAQLYGRKQWILLPPSEAENLSPIRVPYEESSVYSSINFYAPTRDILNIKGAQVVILEPGDVLFVPRHWWHFVENLEVSISVNTWIPMKEDCISQVDEALVQWLISAVCQDLTENDAKSVLNPNEYHLLNQPCQLSTLEKVAELKNEQDEKPQPCKSEKPQPLLPNMHILAPIAMKQYLEDKQRQLKYTAEAPTLPPTPEATTLKVVKAAINAFCDPRIISLVRERFLTEIHNNSNRP